MPKDFITVTKGEVGEKFASELLNGILLTRSLIDQLEKLNGIMLHNIDGADYTDAEELFGLPAGNGDEVYNLIAGILGALKGTTQSSDALTLIDRVG